MDPAAETETRDLSSACHPKTSSIEQAGADVLAKEEALYLELGGDGVLVHVDVVLVDGCLDELVTLGLHPRGDERRQVQPRVPVQHQLVVDDLVRRLLGDRLLRHPEPAARPAKNITGQSQTPRRRGQRGWAIRSAGAGHWRRAWGVRCGRNGRRRLSVPTHRNRRLRVRAPLEPGEEEEEKVLWALLAAWLGEGQESCRGNATQRVFISTPYSTINCRKRSRVWGRVM
jgi:hypothetical protein